jgi:hypothetical protein
VEFKRQISNLERKREEKKRNWGIKSPFAKRSVSVAVVVAYQAAFVGCLGKVEANVAYSIKTHRELQYAETSGLVD